MNSIKRVMLGIVKYLSDWKNLLSHSLVGVVFLLIAIYTPVNIFIKLGVIAVIVTINLNRMKKRSKREVENEHI